MAGILDHKRRLIDTILTTEGKRQLANGELEARFYSFTDSSMVYTEDTIVSGGLDTTYRIQLEATNLPQDRITLEADDSGRLTGFPVSGSSRFIARDGQILSGNTPGQKPVQVTGSQFSTLSEQVLDSSIENFKKLYILQSPDPVDNRPRDFRVSKQTQEFSITPERPLSSGSVQTANLDNVESFFQDKRLSHIPNYQFLPPVNKARIGRDRREPLGNYIDIRQTPILSFEDVDKELSKLEAEGYVQDVTFTETSRENNLHGQFFELSGGEMTKLDVIDFGSFPTEDGPAKRVFFAGKVFIDSKGTHTFVNMFTLVFE